ncbi:MAG: amidohydrolase family protein [Clostridia bacterium]|nr:amidohydrolase family protein [Clostridia bacterium]
MIVDIHTHTFPERIAAAALRKMQGQCHTALFTGATEPELTASMRRAGIDRSVILPVSTNPQHVVKVNDASLRINECTEETGLISFGCMHPDYDDVDGELGRIAKAGIRGIKLHPVYQRCDIDDPRSLRILRAAADHGLSVIIHAGYDVGYPGETQALPEKIARALEAVGPVRMILAHMGGWRCWEEAARLLGGSGVYIDTAFSLGPMHPIGDGFYNTPESLARMDAEAFTRQVRAFGADHVLFGTDSPWEDQVTEVQAIRALPLTGTEQDAILGGNACRLLGL